MSCFLRSTFYIDAEQPGDCGFFFVFNFQSIVFNDVTINLRYRDFLFLCCVHFETLIEFLKNHIYT